MTKLMGIKLEFISVLYELNISWRNRQAEQESEEEDTCWQLLVLVPGGALYQISLLGVEDVKGGDRGSCNEKISTLRPTSDQMREGSVQYSV